MKKIGHENLILINFFSYNIGKIKLKRSFYIMSRLIDLTGQQFGRWTVLKRDTKGKFKEPHWVCQCTCGTIKSVQGTSLRSGTSTSCGCYRKENSRINNGKYIDEIGNRYGRLVVIAKDEEDSIKKHRAQWVCRCDCGNIITTSSKCLRDGKTNSCGCLISIGESYITKILNDKNIIYKSQYGVSIDDKWYRFDFAILDSDNNVVRFIEYDGIQHYNENQKHWGKSSKEIQQKDKIKNNYAFSHNIPLVRIPYTEKDNITIDLLLGDKYLLKEAQEDEVV